MFTITVTEAELDVVRLALGRMLSPRKVADRTTKAPTASAPVFATGDDALDAFMRRSWTPASAVAAAKRASAGLVKAAPLKPRAWSKADNEALDKFNADAVAAWRRLGHEVTVKGTRGVDRNGANVSVRAL